MSGSKYAQALLHYVDSPALGSWQYAIRPGEDGTYSLHASPPDSDQWSGPLMGSTGLDLGTAVRRMNQWRQQSGGGT